MICEKLIKGFDDRCSKVERRYLQKAVLMNYKEIVFQSVNSSSTKHNIIFSVGTANLPPPSGGAVIKRTGYPFYSLETGDVIKGSFDMARNKGVAMYTHNISIRISGVSENVKTLQKQLDKGLFLGALKFSDGTIEIYGAGYGLKIQPYSFVATNGGVTLELESSVSEYEPPFVYAGDKIDYDNNWDSDIQIIDLLGEFNNDFNNDFRRTFQI